MAWNFGDILDTIIPVLPDNHLALVHGDREMTWAQISSRSNNLGRFMLENGANIGDKVGFYMRNRPEYMETLINDGTKKLFDELENITSAPKPEAKPVPPTK